MNLKNFPKRLDSKTSCLRITVPENLDVALEGLIRKVLREQPKTDDIHSFAADYFEKLLRIRDEAGARYTPGQLCPFHDDEDAHEMIKLAKTFNKADAKKDGKEDVQAVERGKRSEAKGQSRGSRRGAKVRERESKRVEKGNELSKQGTPDLIKKLPRGDGGGSGEEKKGVTEGEGEGGGEEQLENDPIRELVERELMMEASKEGKIIGAGLGNEEKGESAGEEKLNEPMEEDKGEEVTRVDTTGDTERPEIDEKTSKEEVEREVEEMNKITDETTQKGEEEEGDELEGGEKEENTMKSENAKVVVQDNLSGTPQDSSEKDEGERNRSEVSSGTENTETIKVENESENPSKEKEVKNNSAPEETRPENDTKPIFEKEDNKEEKMDKEDKENKKEKENKDVENKEDKENKERKEDEENQKDKEDKEPQETVPDGKADVKIETAVDEEVNEEISEKADDLENEEKDGGSKKELDSVKDTEPGEDQGNEENKPESKEEQLITLEDSQKVNDNIAPEEAKKPGSEESVTSENVIVDRKKENGVAPATDKNEAAEPRSDQENPDDIGTEESTATNLDEPTVTEVEEQKETIAKEAPTEDKTMEVPPPTEEKLEAPEPEGEELCTVVDIQHGCERMEVKDSGEGSQQKEGKAEPEEELCVVVDSQHIIRVEEPEEVKENPEPAEEVQVKTIQTHYYDTLQVPDATTKELRIHSMSAVPPVVSPWEMVESRCEEVSGPLLELAEEKSEEAGLEDEKVEPEASQREGPEIDPVAVAELNRQELGSESHRSEGDELLDVMTPTSGYSLNLSDLSWQTISGVFLDSERQYSSLEKEEVRPATPKSIEGGRKAEEGRAEVEEIFEKTEVPSRVKAVPVPPRGAEEIREEEGEGLSVKEEEKEKAGEEGARGEGFGGSEGESSNGKSIGSDVPLVSVEVKTVIESEVAGEDEEEESLREVEVAVEVEVVDAEEEEKRREESECKGEGKEKPEGGGGGAVGEERGGCGEGTAMREGSSGESESTASSTATEIKRSEFARRNGTNVGSTGRSTLMSQSLDKHEPDSEGRNPLLRTRSLSTFRHGVTDFEVWNAIEKELEEAATKIQSRFRSYKTRKKLQRENAVQITTEESSPSTSPAETDQRQHSTGEFHDSIVLSEHPR